MSDILMPVMDGFALCREARRDPLLASVPIVLHTLTYVESKDEEFALALGATRYLVKPSDPAQLVADVREVLAQGHTGGVAASTEDETSFLQQYSERLAAKLEEKLAELEETNRRLELQNQETAAARDRLALLLATSQLASSSLDSNLLLGHLVERMVSSLRVTFGRVSLLDQDGERLVVQTAWPIRTLDWDLGINQTIPLSDAPLHRFVLASGEPRIVRLDDEHGEMMETERRAARLEGCRAVLLIPLSVAGKPAAMLCLGEARQWKRSPLTLEHIELAQGMAAQVMLAVENARLHQAQVRAEREGRILADVGALFASASSLGRFSARWRCGPRRRLPRAARCTCWTLTVGLRRRWCITTIRTCGLAPRSVSPACPPPSTDSA